MTDAGWTAERKLVEELLTFIEATSGRKLKFSTIANLKTGKTEDPQHRIAAWLKRHLDADRQQGKVEGIQESKNLVSEFIEAWLLAGMVAKLLTPAVHEAVGGLSRDLRRELQKIEQAAQDEKGVGDA